MGLPVSIAQRRLFVDAVKASISLKVHLQTLACVVVVTFAALAQGGNPVTEIHTQGIQQGTVGLGMGWRWGDSPYRGIQDIGSIVNDNEYDLMPFYFYEGKVLFARGSSAGIHLFNGGNFTLDAVLDYRFDRLEADKSDYFRTVEDREQSLDGGLEGRLSGDWGEASLSWVTDTLDRHNGQEVDLTYRYAWDSGKWTFSPFASYVYQNADLLDYYYGVSAEEARDDLPEYEPGSGELWRMGFNASYRWSKRMRLFANFSVDSLPDETRDSPLVDEDWIHSAMVGLAYGFGSVYDEEAASRRAPERGGEWSWRVNYGYTAEETFHKVHRGYIRSSDDVDTHLAGFTVGKLLLDNTRADFWGKVSINRRFEDNEQEDFFEINPYVMVMGTGYSPWTSREVFRYGFGYGFSYADKVPIVEQKKQAKRDGNTSHFLNYLEAQIDFPLRNVFKGRGWWQNCYAGLTLVHRSGIFGQVDILGNVSGGSDVLTGHLECTR